MQLNTDIANVTQKTSINKTPNNLRNSSRHFDDFFGENDPLLISDMNQVQNHVKNDSFKFIGENIKEYVDILAMKEHMKGNLSTLELPDENLEEQQEEFKVSHHVIVPLTNLSNSKVPTESTIINTNIKLGPKSNDKESHSFEC